MAARGSESSPPPAAPVAEAIQQESQPAAQGVKEAAGPVGPLEFKPRPSKPDTTSGWTPARQCRIRRALPLLSGYLTRGNERASRLVKGSTLDGLRNMLNLMGQIPKGPAWDIRDRATVAIARELTQNGLVSRTR